MAVKAITDLVDSHVATVEQFLANLDVATARLRDALLAVIDWCAPRCFRARGSTAMKVGMFVSDTGGRRSSLDEVAELARWCDEAGLAGGWVPYLPWSLDAFVALTVAAQATTRIELGTAVVPTYPFHPMAMARSALSVNAVPTGDSRSASGRRTRR